VRVRADEPDAQSKLEVIHREAAQAKDVRGQPLQPGTDAYENWVRRRAVAAGLSPRSGVEIVLDLRQSSAPWRAPHLSLEPLPVATAPIAAVPPATSAAADRQHQ